eukprot:355237-Chlamydomonas_euryale.AAC.6
MPSVRESPNARTLSMGELTSGLPASCLQETGSNASRAMQAMQKDMGGRAVKPRMTSSAVASRHLSGVSAQLCGRAAGNVGSLGFERSEVRAEKV